MINFFPHWESNISTKALDNTWVSVSQVEIDPQAVFIFDANVHFVEIKASAFESDVVLNDGTDGGDDVEIIQVLQRKLWWEVASTGDVVLVNEENYRLFCVFLFQPLTKLGKLFILIKSR